MNVGFNKCVRFCTFVIMIKTEPTIITVTHHGRTYTIELPWDADTEDIRQAYRGLMFLMGFSVDSIDGVVPEE